MPSSLVNNDVYAANKEAIDALYDGGGNYAPCSHSGLTLAPNVDVTGLLGDVIQMPARLEQEEDAEYGARNGASLISIYNKILLGPFDALVFEEERHLTMCKKHVAGWPADVVS